MYIMSNNIKTRRALEVSTPSCPFVAHDRLRGARDLRRRERTLPVAHALFAKRPGSRPVVMRCVLIWCSCAIVYKIRSMLYLHNSGRFEPNSAAGRRAWCKHARRDPERPVRWLHEFQRLAAEPPSLRVLSPAGLGSPLAKPRQPQKRCSMTPSACSGSKAP